MRKTSTSKKQHWHPDILQEAIAVHTKLRTSKYQSCYLRWIYEIRPPYTVLITTISFLIHTCLVLLNNPSWTVLSFFLILPWLCMYLPCYYFWGTIFVYSDPTFSVQFKKLPTFLHNRFRPRIQAIRIKGEEEVVRAIILPTAWLKFWGSCLIFPAHLM